jgi:outer membrane biosynthesis protein TonB
MRRLFEGSGVISTALKPSSVVKTACSFLLLVAFSATAAAQSQSPSTPPSPTSSPAPAPAEQTQPPPPAVQSTDPQPTPPAQESAPAKATTRDDLAKPEKDPTLQQGDFSIHTVGGEIKEDQLRQMLVGKTLYLRSGYQDNNLEFDEHGRLVGHSPQGSYTLSQIQINTVKLSKKKMELVGDRYALHFLGGATYDNPTTATDRVKINPKKKAVRISFDREEVEKPKKEKDKGEKKKDKHHANADIQTSTVQPAAAIPSVSDNADAHPAVSGLQPANSHASDKKRTTTDSAVQASQMLLAALDNVFSIGIDERMIAAMPDFWKLYYQAGKSRADYKPTDPGVFSQSTVDQKAKLISAIDPPSNEVAQANGVAGMALYHAVIGSDGKAREVVAGRPIGFGLDESAEQTIRKATFQPAVKDGKPVPVALEVVVSFRIYSKRTSQPAPATQAEEPKKTVLPGPYTEQVQAQVQAQAQPQAPSPQPSATPR